MSSSAPLLAWSLLGDRFFSRSGLPSWWSFLSKRQCWAGGEEHKLRSYVSRRSEEVLVCSSRPPPGSVVQIRPTSVKIFDILFLRTFQYRVPGKWFWMVGKCLGAILLIFENHTTPSKWIIMRTRAVGGLKFWEEMRTIHISSDFLETKQSIISGVMSAFVQTRIHWITPK